MALQPDTGCQSERETQQGGARGYDGTYGEHMLYSEHSPHYSLSLIVSNQKTHTRITILFIYI